MACEECEKEKKQQLLSDQFGDELAQLLEKYRGELNSGDIALGLILEAKIEMCCVSPCYYHMVGELFSMLNFQLRQMWEEMKPQEEGEE